jgi:hypothetical protein
MRITMVMIRILEAPLKCILFVKLSFLYDQNIATTNTIKNPRAKTIFPVVNIFLRQIEGAIYTFTPD